MTKKDIYRTHAASITLSGIILYCYNEKVISLQEFTELENQAFMQATQRQWRLFKMYQKDVDGEGLDIFRVSYN